jgi:hypothetical protein
MRVTRGDRKQEPSKHKEVLLVDYALIRRQNRSPRPFRRGQIVPVLWCLRAEHRDGMAVSLAAKRQTANRSSALRYGPVERGQPSV